MEGNTRNNLPRSYRSYIFIHQVYKVVKRLLDDKGKKDDKGYCKSDILEEIRKNDYVLTPGRYVGTAVVEEDDEVFEEKMKKLMKELREKFKESNRLEKESNKNLTKYGLKK